ncbi:RING-type E3 ubiquitin transferase [Salvia divinorum]|uniref:RING-type E3 ubiquitin transferase n=1 Tax=Salvia divinorum TaxID=28513 RepID=A0ABD1H5Z5_SALDI
MQSLSDRSVRFLITKLPLRQTIFPGLVVKFNLFFNTDSSNYTIKLDSGKPVLLCYNRLNRIPAFVVFKESFSEDAIREAVGKAIDDRLLDDERSRAIRLACDEVRESFITLAEEILPKHVELTMHMNIWITYFYASVPDREEEPCSICLIECGDDDVVTMLPCAHMFHGNCIRRWLLTTINCPVCRYEMPG